MVLLARCLLVIVLLGLISAPARAVAVPHAPAVRLAERPVIDGRLDDPPWAGAPVHDSFTQIEPAQGSPPTERTAFRVGYDDQQVYIGVDCYDADPSGVAARLTRRDRDIEADWVAVSLDSRNDRNSAGLWTAAKVSGEIGDGLSLGALAALVGGEDAEEIDAMTGESHEIDVAPTRSYGALRGRYALGGGGSFVGLTGTSVTRLGGSILRADADHDGYVQAADLFVKADSGRFLGQAQIAVSERVGGPSYHLPDGRACNEADSLSDPTCVPIARADGTHLGPGATGVGIQARTNYESSNRLLKIEYMGHTAKFDPNDAGFAPRFNVNEGKIVGGFVKKTPDAYTNFRGIFPFVVGSMAMDGTPQFLLFGVDIDVMFKNFMFSSPEQYLDLPGGFDIYETLDGARFETPAAWEGHWQTSTNPAKALGVELNLNWFLALGDENRSGSAELIFNLQAASNLELSIGGSVGREHAVRFYDCATPSGRSCLVENGMRHYLFADLDSEFLSLTLRGTFTLNPRLSFQAYAQYFVADGDFSDFKSIDTMGRHPEIRRDDLRPATFSGDSDGDGAADGDFETASLNANVVLRWEPRPGTTLYAVYTRAQESLRVRLAALDEGPTEEVLLLKFVYFLN